jgi:hypothetical protein
MIRVAAALVFALTAACETALHFASPPDFAQLESGVILARQWVRLYRVFFE